MTEPARVTLLTQPDCAFCDHAKQVIARVSQDHALVIDEIDLASERGHQLAMTHGVLFAPGVLLDGQSFSYGRLSEKRLRKALSRTEVPAQ